MPTTRLIPNGSGFYGQWDTNDTAAVASDDTATYIVRTTATGSLNKTSSYAMAGLPAIAARISGPVRVGIKVRENPTETIGNPATPMVRYNGVDLFLPGQDVGTSWVEVTNDAVTPPGGGGWTPPIVNVMECGVASGAPDAGTELRCSFIYADVTWYPATGGFAYLVLPFPWAARRPRVR